MYTNLRGYLRVHVFPENPAGIVFTPGPRVVTWEETSRLLQSRAISPCEAPLSRT